MNYDDLVLELEYVADHIGEMDLWPYEETLRNAAKLIQELQRDAMRYEALRNQVCSDISVCRGVERHDATELFGTELDAAIDEAMQHEAG